MIALWLEYVRFETSDWRETSALLCVDLRVPRSKFPAGVKKLGLARGLSVLDVTWMLMYTSQILETFHVEK